ncbi:MAG: APC family permease [Alicyclobacillus macrosporangiidus]|uniref:APC family permease n=1 Tax=Alicyclobacillus macrosporangiidus TaxID=392015 RepID=UPI0026EFC97F|nr:APC family permease [Alicyclobacillus macrosporangiidus]MCL6599873.1 APC family permease [Alicyclobacillus macrosporangiidus]
MASEERVTLRKDALTFVDVMTSGLANMGPAMSLFFSTAFLVGTLGEVVPFEIVLALLAVLTLGNTLSEFSRKIPSAGSFITFVGRTFGVKFATASALTLVVGYIIAISGVIAVLGGWTQTLIQRYTGVTIPWIPVTLLGVMVIAYLTIRGIKIAAEWAVILFIFEAVMLLVLAVVILFTEKLSAAPFNPVNASQGLKGLALGFPLVIFLFVGWENSAALAEETQNPRKNVPRAIYAGIVIITLLYILSSFTSMIGYGLSPEKLSELANDSGPYDTLGQKYLGHFRLLLDLAGFSSIFATIIAAANSQTRILYNAGREGFLPRFFGTVGRKHQTPHVALLTYLGLATLIAMVFGYKNGPSDVFGWMSTLGTVPLIAMYAVSNIALPIFYYRYHRNEFKLFRHGVVPVLGVLLLIWPFWGLVQPGQEFPYNLFPWIFLTLVIVSVIWTVHLFSSKRGRDLDMSSFKAFEHGGIEET